VVSGSTPSVLLSDVDSVERSVVVEVVGGTVVVVVVVVSTMLLGRGRR